jgi:hypothetical protein
VNDLLQVSGGGNPTPLGTDNFTLNINATNTSLVGGTYHIIDSATPLNLDPAKWSVGTNNASGTYTYAFSLDGSGDLVLGVTPLVVGPTESTWNKDDSVSVWSDTNSWIGGVPNAVDAKAKFGSIITDDRTVTVDFTQTVGTLTFDNAKKYTLVEGNFGGLIVIDSATAGSVVVNNGSHDIVAPVQLNKDTTFDVGPAASVLTVSNLTATGVNVTKQGSGMLAVNRVRSNDLTVSGGTLKIQPNGLAAGVSKVAQLAVTGGAKLDLTDNKLITASPVGSATGGVYSGVTGAIQSGRNGGAWNGSGIVTSSATGSLTTIGVASAQQALGLSSGSATGVWAGQAVSGSDTLVMYTYGGDANLDGKINVDDYGHIDTSIPLGLAGWFNGDFNYDGKINVDDYGIIDFNIGIQGAPIFTAGGSSAASSIGGVSAVPEPASIGLVSLGAAALVGGRRRRKVN